MFDTMTMTKVLGALCGSLLIYMLGAWAGELVYHGSGGHGDGDHSQGYVIEIADAEEAADTEEEEIDLATLLAEADPAKGEKVFSKCKACHKLDGVDGTGPHLDGVVDRDIGAVAGYGYSTVLAEKEGDWTAEALDGFLADPKGWAPGTKMGFAGLKKIQDRVNLIAYLGTFGG